MIKEENIKVHAVFTEGYQTRFTEAFLKIYDRREKERLRKLSMENRTEEAKG